MPGEDLQAAEALRRNEALLLSITQHTRDIIVVKDEAGRYLFVNPAGCRAMGVLPEEVLGRTDLECHPGGEQARRFMADDRRIMEAQQAEIYEEDFISRSGEKSVLLTNKMPRLDAEGRVIGVIAVCRDITERKRLEAEVLAIREKERLRVAADLHDGICQELVGIQYLVSTLRRDLEETRHPLAARAGRIEAAIIGTTEHTRQVARGMNPVVADGNGLMHALRLLAVTTASARRLRCVFRCPAPVVIEDPTVANELYRIAQEAMHNALRHSRARQITVRLSERGGQVELAVLDNGRGLPADLDGAPGMGLRVMRYRAGLIGGQLAIQPRRRGGTEVACRVANPLSTP